jgi:2-alkenal reductase
LAGLALAAPTLTPSKVVAVDTTPVPARISNSDTVYEQIYNQVSPSVVSINVVATRPGSFMSPQTQVTGTGSGFVVDTNGDIVTNNHVVDGATDIEVNFVDGTIVRGEVVGTDANSDLAVVKVDLSSEQLHPVEFADSDTLAIGQSVLAIGSPFGERWTLTSGIISGLGRTIDGLNNFSIGGVIQTDAAINPGNSGGPLLDLEGHVIGVNSQIMSESRSSAGVGFAIPSNLVQHVMQELISDGQVDYSYLGIEGADMNLAVIDALHLSNNQRGVIVTNVVSGGPADEAGLKPAETQGSNDVRLVSADIITAIDGTPLNGMESLISYLANHTTPGQQITLTVLRDGKSIDLQATLTARPSQAH